MVENGMYLPINIRWKHRGRIILCINHVSYWKSAFLNACMMRAVIRYP